MHLLLVALLASLVHLSSPRKIDDNEVFMKLDDGFPDGSLLTVFFKFTGPDRSIGINLYEDVSTDKGRLHFRMDSSENLVSRRGQDGIDEQWWPGVSADESKPLKYGSVNPPEAQPGSWWRFDLYKISETEYLPFFNGFAVKKRKLLSPGKSSAVYIVPKPDNNLNPNFDKDDVYVTIKHPEIGMKCEGTECEHCKPERVLDSFDRQIVDADILKPINKFKVRTLKGGFPVGKTIRLSALMLSADADHTDLYSTLYFSSPGGEWAFGIVNKWHDGNDAMPKGTKLYLLVGFDVPKTQGQIWPAQAGGSHYQDVMCDGDSTDILHVKFWRPDTTTIKMRIYYKDEKAAGKTCELTNFGPKTIDYLDKGPLEVLEHQGAKLLHIDMV